MSDETPNEAFAVQVDIGWPGPPNWVEAYPYQFDAYAEYLKGGRELYSYYQRGYIFTIEAEGSRDILVREDSTRMPIRKAPIRQSSTAWGEARKVMSPSLVIVKHEGAPSVSRAGSRTTLTTSGGFSSGRGGAIRPRSGGAGRASSPPATALPRSKAPPFFALGKIEATRWVA